jgi:hypothetical protein
MSDTKALNNLRDTAQRERDRATEQLERIGRGLWQILAATITAANAQPGEITLVSRVQTAASMYETWAAVVDGHGEADRG